VFDQAILGADAINEFGYYHWRWAAIEGFILILLGMAAIVLPLIAGLVIATGVGLLLMLSGLIGLWTSWSMRNVRGAGWAVASSMLALVAGIAFFMWPVGV
jgi:uncharacterized membrane protein HdeD (DUF308 family)